MSVVPKTYIAYDDNGYEICRYRAPDANKDINPKDVEQKASKVIKTTTDIISNYNKKMDDLKNFSFTAIIIKDYDFEDVIDEIIKSTKTLNKQIDNYMNQIVKAASSAHDELQTNYNKSARSKAYSCSNNVKGYE